jgi:hypothetical protein
MSAATEQRKSGTKSKSPPKAGRHANNAIEASEQALGSLSSSVEEASAQGSRSNDGGWLSWWWSAPENEDTEIQEVGEAAVLEAPARPLKYVHREKKTRVKHAKENAKLAKKARAEREERKRFKELQQEQARQRSDQLKAQHRRRPQIEQQAMARKQAASARGGQAVQVVSLGSMSSAERAEVQKILRSPVL